MLESLVVLTGLAGQRARRSAWLLPEVTLSEERLSEIYQQFAPMIFRRSLALLADREEALDAVQDIFVKLHHDLPTFRGESALLSWIFRITTNHCLNQLRARKTRQRAHQQLERQDLRRVDSSAGAVERRDLIRHLLGRFSPRKVQIVLHRYYDEMTQDEVAALMGISDRAVRKSLKAVRDQVAAMDASLETLQEAR